MLVIDTYGLDPAPTHGALVRATWQLGPTKLLEYEVIYEWVGHPGIDKSNPQAMRYLATQMITELKKDPLGDRVGVDYDSSSLFWGGHPQMAVGLAYTLGYFDSGIKELGLRLILVTPLVVRHYFGESVKATKAEVWRHLKLPAASEDIKDALVLSYVVAAMEDIRDVSPSRKTTVSRQRTKAPAANAAKGVRKARTRI